MKLRDDDAGEAPVLVPSGEDCHFLPDLPPDLARVAAAWGDLPDAIKAAILALVDAAEKTAGGARG